MRSDIESAIRRAKAQLAYDQFSEARRRQIDRDRRMRAELERAAWWRRAPLVKDWRCG